MGRRRILELVVAGGWLAVLGLAASTVGVTLGAGVISFAPADAVEVDAPQEEDEEDEEPAAPIARSRTPVTLARNPFCPTCSADAPPTDEPVVLAGGSLAPIEGARRTQLPITLNATLEARWAKASLAVIHDHERGTLGPYAIGDMLRPGVRLDSIGPGSILLSNNGVTEYALVDDTPPPPEPKTESSKPASSRAEPLGADRVSCSGTTCTVQRSFVNELLADPSVLMGQGNVLPTTTADGRSGFRISGARKGTLPRLLGLRNGDVLVSVGGEAATIDTLLSLRTRFDRLDQIELTVLRGNQPVDLTLVFAG